MKYNLLHIAAGMALCLGMLSCTSDEENAPSTSIPDGALPSETFVPNRLADEPYAEEAILVKVEDYDAPFYSLELMGDGHYLLSPERDYYYSNSRADQGGKLGNTMLHKAPGVRTATRASDSNTQTASGKLYGNYEVIGEKVYRLDNGMVVDMGPISENEGVLRYRNDNGTWSTVSASAWDTPADEATRSICRGWDVNIFEFWIYFNGYYIAHGKEVIKDQKCERYFKCLGEDLFDITEDDYFDDQSDVAYHVYFSANGTYVCYFLNGTIETRNWKWEDATRGTLRFYDYDASSGIGYGGYDTVRFAGSQMRIYEDFTDYEDEASVRCIAVNTFTAS
ncbi:MAG: hypothetical protein ACI36Z_09300 [Alloprevotella sp.]